MVIANGITLLVKVTDPTESMKLKSNQFYEVVGTETRKYTSKDGKPTISDCFMVVNDSEGITSVFPSKCIVRRKGSDGIPQVLYPV